MKQILFRALVLAAFITSIGYAQPGKITSAVMEYDDQNFEEAIRLAEEGLKNTAELKETHYAKAYGTIFRSYVTLYSALRADAAKLKTFWSKYPDWTNRAFEAMELTNKYNPKNKFEGVYVGLLGEALNAKALEVYYTPGTRDLNKIIDLLDKSKKCFTIAGTPAPAASYLKGYTLMERKTAADSTAAIAELKESIAEYNKLAGSPDKMQQEAAASFAKTALPSVYGGLINLYGLHKKDMNLAMATAKEGTEKFGDNESIKNAQTNLLLNGANYDVAAAAFEKRIAAGSKDAIDYVGYGQLLHERYKAKYELRFGESPDKSIPIDELKGLLTKAIGLYEKGIPLEKGGNSTFNLAVVHNNYAVLYQKMLDELDPVKQKAEYDAATAGKEEQLTKAYTYMVKVQASKPSDKNVLRQLVNMSVNLKKYDEMKKWKEQLDALGG